MIYKFKSKAAGDVVMLESSGNQLMRLLGREPSAKGIIEVAAMPAAIQALEQAVSAEETAASAESDQPAASPDGGVSLRQRVWPLIEMMRRSQAAGQDIVWGV